jgi:hypothetical protein
MPASVSGVAIGLQARLATISGLRAYSTQPEQLNPPFAFPILQQIEFHRAMGGGDVVMTWGITAITGRWTDRTAHDLLDGYLSYSGASSIRAALEADLTLGGVCQTLIVSSAANITALTVADAQFLQVQFTVSVHG